MVTWVLSAFVPVDEAGDEHDQREESDGAHQADEPALGRDSTIHPGLACWEGEGGVGCGGRGGRGGFKKKKQKKKKKSVTLTRLGLFIGTLDWMFTIDAAVRPVERLQY